MVRGDLTSGARYVVEAPADWNGTLLVWSPGYIGGRPGGEATAGPGGVTRSWLLDEGYALASSKPVGNGWAVEELLRDQVEVVGVSAAELGATPERTIAWGDSMGGLTSAALVENHPETFDGALPICASVAGGVGMLNQGLDGSFVFRTLLAPDDDRLQLVDVTDERLRTTAAREVLTAAQETPAGRARIAFAAAVAQLSTWSAEGTPEPGPRDWAAQQLQQQSAFMFAVFSPRQPLEQRAGGNFSWNVGVDYHQQLVQSGSADLVRALYREAGLDLDADLAALAAAPRIAADREAVDYMLANATPRGAIQRPVLTLHETGDNAPQVTQARAYADAVTAAGSHQFLRQAFVDRPGHCRYSASERAALLRTLEERIESGRWAATASAKNLAETEAAIDAETALDLGEAGFVDYRPDRFLRAYYP
ncbi:prolyl oligopeptidase family serine peptidase [Blastococcus montanus]|uniref:prolyl oligopeptidase family serine peptidase n=1 Tax=Blastococcus montanus TaxID=3144973 RepID=UPI003207F2B1